MQCPKYLKFYIRKCGGENNRCLLNEESKCKTTVTVNNVTCSYQQNYIKVTIGGI